MITIHRLNARGENKNGESVVDYLLATETMKADYYHGPDTMMRWGGKGADSLGLDEEVTKDAMLSLASGFDPKTERALCQNAGEKPVQTTKQGRDGKEYTVWEGGHRVGFDMTFTPNKPVSMLFALGTSDMQNDALEAHRDAVSKALEYLESKVETRRGKGGKDFQGVSGLVWSEHDHLANRNLEANIHTHTLIYGVAQGEDGQWSTFDAKELYRHRYAADMIYQNELACNLRERGYGIEQYEDEQNGEAVKRWGIQGISKELCQAFSTRREEILKYQEETGVSAQQACLATRKHKDEPSIEEMRYMWKEVAGQLGPEMSDLSHIRDHVKDVELEHKGARALSMELHKTEAIVCEHDLIKLIGQEHIGFLRTDDLLAKVEAFKEEAGLIEVGAKIIHEDDAGDHLSRINTETRFQAGWLHEQELQVVHSSLRRSGEKHLELGEKTVNQAIAAFQAEKGFTISDEQRKAVEHLTRNTQGVGILEGFAGTGKTTVSDIYKRAFEAEGFELVGVCLNNAAAKKLEQESGMSCFSVAKTMSMLEKGQLSLSEKHVVVIDEAGMVDTNNMSRLMQFAEDKGAKVILQGDENQLQPIQAGSGFTLAKGAIGAEQLTEIRRQKTQELRDLAHSFYDDTQGPKSRAQEKAKGDSILKRFDSLGVIHEYQTHNEARKELVDAYMEDKASTDEKLILAHTRDDVRFVTDDIRQRLKEQGELSQYEEKVKCYINKEWEEQSFAKGDRIRFRARDEGLGVVNGTEGTVERVRKDLDGGVVFTVQSEGRTLEFSSYEFNAISHNYAMTVHSAQGQGKESVYHLYNQGMSDNQSMLVAATRTKERYQLYGQKDELDGIADRLGMDRKKENAFDTPKAKQETTQAPEEQRGFTHSPKPQQARTTQEKVHQDTGETHEERRQRYGLSL